MSGHLQKTLLILLSLLAIALISQNWVTPVFVMALLSANYFLMAGRLALPHGEKVLLWANWIVLPLGFFLLQEYGYVGVLGNNLGYGSVNAVWLLGLPFYTLSILSLNHEIQTGKMLRPSWTDYVLFVIYFPKFLSGPVEQPGLVARLANFRFSYARSRFDSASEWIILGVFCKFVIAYYLSKNVHTLEMRDLPTIVLSVVCFELQVYFDLAGYSFMAFGLSRLLGLELTLNFNHPFFSGNIQSFWQRWHISLGRWFHQYVYTPLRALDPHSTALKLMLPLLVFLLSAMWHGQTLNFLVWGLWHGLAYLVYVRLLSARHWPAWTGLPALLLVLLFGRFLFMEANFHYLMLKLTRLLSWSAWQEGWGTLWELHFDIRSHACVDLLVAFLLSAGFLWAESRNVRQGRPAYAIFRDARVQWLMVVLALLLLEGAPKGFIYARQ